MSLKERHPTLAGNAEAWFSEKKIATSKETN